MTGIRIVTVDVGGNKADQYSTVNYHGLHGLLQPGQFDPVHVASGSEAPVQGSYSKQRNCNCHLFIDDGTRTPEAAESGGVRDSRRVRRFTFGAQFDC